jgi:hypothetical protein
MTSDAALILSRLMGEPFAGAPHTRGIACPPAALRHGDAGIDVHLSKGPKRGTRPRPARRDAARGGGRRWGAVGRIRRVAA